MKRHIYIMAFALVILGLEIKIDTYAASISSYRHYEGSSSTSYSEVEDSVIYNQNLTLNNVKVKMTQDDNKYIFKVTANGSYDVKTNLGSNCLANYHNVLVPFLYKNENFGNSFTIYELDYTPFADNYGTITVNSWVKINNIQLAYYIDKYKISSSGYTTQYDYQNTSNGDKYFIPVEARFHMSKDTYNFKNSKKYPTGWIQNNGDGVQLINNSGYVGRSSHWSNSNEYVDQLNLNYNSTISIEKEYIDNYRYLCFGSPYAVYTQEQYGTIQTNIKGYSLISNTIDLKDYVDCDHDWVAAQCDESKHILKCSKCEWEKEEEHNFEYEYDGISNNACVCTETKKVKYYYDINDDIISTASNVFDVDEECVHSEYTKKTGYIFKWYEKYELEVDCDDLKLLATKSVPTKKVYVTNTTSLDEKAGSRSVYYKAIYTPIQYKFVYSTKSNIEPHISRKLKYDTTIPDQIFTYDKKAHLSNHVDYDYLIFKGWTLVEGTEKVDFHDKGEVLNYTTENDKEYTLYPIYEPMKYKVLYNTLTGYFDNHSQQANAEYDFYVDEGFLTPLNMGTNKEFSHYVDLDGNTFETLDEVRDYVKSDIENNQTVILFAKSKSVVSDTNDGDKEDENDEGDEGGDKKDSEESGEGGSSSGGGSSSEGGSSSDGEEKSSNVSDDSSNNSSDNASSNDNNSNSDSGKSNSNSSGSSSSGSSSSGSSSSGSSSNGSSGKGITSSGTIINGIITSKESTVDDKVVENKTAETAVALTKNTVTTKKVEKATKEDKEEGKDNKKRNESNENDESKENLEGDEDATDDFYGPRLLYEDGDTDSIVRGLHGPWYLEQEYIDKILSARGTAEDDAKEENSEFGILAFNILNTKSVLLLAGGVALVILVIIYEIFTIKGFKEKKE